MASLVGRRRRPSRGPRTSMPAPASSPVNSSSWITTLRALALEHVDQLRAGEGGVEAAGCRRRAWRWRRRRRRSRGGCGTSPRRCRPRATPRCRRGRGPGRWSAGAARRRSAGPRSSISPTRPGVAHRHRGEAAGRAGPPVLERLAHPGQRRRAGSGAGCRTRAEHLGARADRPRPGRRHGRATTAGQTPARVTRATWA